MRSCRHLPRSLLFQTVLSMWCLFLSAAVVCYHVFGGIQRVVINSDFELENWSESTNTSWKPALQRIVGREVGVPTVVVLTYQRCGSSFYGNMFNTNPSAFYAFEPLDSVYSALYGTKHGYNVPTDIHNYSNGTKRLLTDAELVAVSRFITDLFSCDVDSLPTDFLVHSFWTQMPKEFTASSPYIRCIKMHVRGYRTRMCDSSNPFHCGKRFGDESDSKLDQCRIVLKYGVNLQNSNGVPHNIQRQYIRYQNCMMYVRKQVSSKCTPLLRNVCSSSQLRSLKTVRASMHSMEPLLRGDPQFRVIHLVRDPRAVIASRLATKDESIVGRYTLLSSSGRPTSSRAHRPVNDSAAVREASMYCRRAVADLRFSIQVRAEYPGRIMTVAYEDVVRNMDEHVESVYRYLGFDGVPNETLAWLKNDKKTKDKRTVTPSVSSLDKWKERLTDSEKDAILNVCSEFFYLVSNVTDSSPFYKNTGLTT